MKLVTVPLELTKEALEETAKESVKTTAEGLTEFGKVGKEAAAEHISLGRLDAGDGESQISFGSNDEDMFLNKDTNLEFGQHDATDNEPDNCSGTEDMAKHDVLLDPQISFRGGLAACNWQCLTSYCYPPNIAKGISTKHPNAPNSHIGHS